MLINQRQLLLQSWLEKDLACVISSIKSASSDASFRRYFRVFFSQSSIQGVESGLSYIVMDAPPENENTTPFIGVTSVLASLNIHVANIYAKNITEGFLLLDDLGQVPYLNKLNPNNADKLYHDAMQVLLRLQAADTSKIPYHLPLYDKILLQQEMNLFEQWFLKVHLKEIVSTEVKNILKNCQQFLLTEIAKQPQVIVHRDFHSRNLMSVDENNPGVIDYQDAVIGACTYDLVSLFRDSYIAWPEEKVQQWLSYFFQASIKNKLIRLDELVNIHHHHSESALFESAFLVFLKWFDLMSVQRQLKVVGIFARLYHRDGKKNYLSDIPQTLSYLFATCAKYPELQHLHQLLAHLINKHQLLGKNQI